MTQDYRQRRGPHRREEALLGVLPISDRARTDLARRMGEPSRHYHTMRHLDLMWERHRHYGSVSNLFDDWLDIPIACAIAYHDAVYVGGATDNEERSARLWLEVSRGVPIDEAERVWVADTIRATADHFDAAQTIDCGDPRGRARQRVLDLDLTPLGEPPDVFDENARLLALELPHLAAAQRRAGIVDSIRRFAAAQPLYRCREIAEAFAAPAQRNFERWLADDAPRAGRI